MSVLIGLIIGLVLGLTGAGGSIFAVPLLMLLLGLPINDAIGIALGAVAVSALIGTLGNWRAQYILWVPALSLGLAGALVAPIGKYLGSQLPPTMLLMGFCLLAFIIAGVMWRQAVTRPERANVVRSGHVFENDLIQPICRFSPDDQFDTSPKCIAALISCGLIVGAIEWTIWCWWRIFNRTRTAIYYSGVNAPSSSHLPADYLCCGRHRLCQFCGIQ